MSKLVYSFDREWIKEKRTEYGNIIRKIEKYVKDKQEGTLIKSDSNSIVLEVEEGKIVTYTLDLYQYVKENFGEEFPWKRVNVDGDITDGDRIKLQEELKIGIHQEEQADNEGRKSNAADLETLEKTIEAISTAEEIKEIPHKPMQDSTQPLENTISKLCENVPMKYSKELQNYLQELGRVIPMLKKMNAIEHCWSRNLLVAIDDGFGFTSFVRALHRVYQACDLIEGNSIDDEQAVREYVITKYSGDNKYSDWVELVKTAREYSRMNAKQSRKVVLAVDIRQWQSEMASAEVREYLRKIQEVNKNFICVFRVSFMEAQVMQDIVGLINDVMGIKLLVVPPVGIADMVDYMKDHLYQMNCIVSAECDEYLEKWIIKEKSDGTFYGYKTLDKMISELIYLKAIKNSESNITDRNIEIENIKEFLYDNMDMTDPYELLGNLIGMSEVKSKIKEIITQIHTQKDLVAQGRNIGRPSIHMMFNGNPGTGKTTVARILAQIMKKEGVLSKGLLFEVRARELCGRYIGETAPKTSTYCRDALGSILFIDEAYTLYRSDSDRDYGKEVIDTLISEMENHKSDFCVIMAGYKDEMQKLLNVNPGLESRIPYIIEFPNYSREEMVQIFFKMMEGKFEYDEDLEETVKEFFDGISDEVMNQKSFSNARLVRNLFERAWGKAAYRRSLNNEESLTIQKEDVYSATNETEFKKLLEEKGKRTKIGFSV